MRKLALGALFIGVIVAAVACSKKNPVGPIIDAPGSGSVDAGSAAICNVLTQTGCPTGDKCTWITDKEGSGSGTNATPTIGHIGCVMDGTVAVGSACSMGPAGPMGYDNCKAGGYCFVTAGSSSGSGTGDCKQICNQNGGAPACPTTGGSANLGFSCATYNGLFGPAGMAVAAGVCDPTCDGLADNDFLTGGSAKSGHGYSASTGNVCAATEGCYIFIGNTGAPLTQMSCAGECSGSGSDCNLVNMSTMPQADGFINACSQGYSPLLFADSGHTTVQCNAYCEPQDCYAGSCGTGVNGNLVGGPAAANGSGHQCLSANARGKFDPSLLGSAVADTNNTHCDYSWEFEIGSNGTIYQSPTSDVLGFCFDNQTTNGGLGCMWDPEGGSNYDTLCEKCDLLPLSGSGNVIATIPSGAGTAPCVGSGGGSCYSGSAGDWFCIKSAELGSGTGTGGEPYRPHLEHLIHRDMGRPMYHATRFRM